MKIVQVIREATDPLTGPAPTAGEISLPPRVVAIVGGSGAGKTWLANQLQEALGRRAARLSQDDFYRDRSYLPLARRGLLNYDHPRAIDWDRLEQVLRSFLAGQPAEVPRYDFATHARRSETDILPPTRILLVDGLWLLRRAAVRRLFALRLFLECPTRLRLERRLARDQIERGRSAASVRDQFQRTVEPMHRRFVAPQARWADRVFKRPCSPKEIDSIVQLLLADDPSSRSGGCAQRNARSR